MGWRSVISQTHKGSETFLLFGELSRARVLVQYVHETEEGNSAFIYSDLSRANILPAKQALKQTVISQTWMTVDH